VFQTDDGEKLPQLGVGLTPGISSTIADSAISFLRRRPDRPFFLHVNFTAPHDPLLWPPGLRDKYQADSIPLPPNFLPEHPFDHGNFEGRDEQLLPWPRTEALVRADLAAYYAVVTYLDQQIGWIVETLKENKLWDSTVVIFTSDHGLAMGSHGLRGKQNMYEHTIGVPLIARGPGVLAGRRTDVQVYLRDIYPTVCNLAGVPVPDTVEAKSFATLLAGKRSEIHPEIYGYFRDSQRMIRTDRWKLIHYPLVEQWQLFDLQRDPFELKSQLGTPGTQAIESMLRNKMTAWFAAREASAK
jgi:arylsulfatase A-like enzyme